MSGPNVLQNAPNRLPKASPAPAQSLRDLSSGGLYRRRSGYFQHPPLPAAHGYLPQPIQSREYRPPSGGPRAVPLRVQRVATNTPSSHLMPIPSSHTRLDRPYSVPVYSNHYINSENENSFTNPPRPATSSGISDVNKLVPPRPVLFPRRRAALGTERSLPASHPVALEESALPSQALTTPRAVAQRGSKKLTPTSSVGEASQHGLAPAAISSNQNMARLARGQKRAADHSDVKSDPPKKVKFNVVRNQLQADTALEVSKHAFPPTSPYPHTCRATNASCMGDTNSELQVSKDVEEPGGDVMVIRSSSDQDEIAKPTIPLTTLEQTKATSDCMPDLYESIDVARLVKRFRPAGTLDGTRSITNFSTDPPRFPSAVSHGSRTHRRNYETTHRQYSNASTQYTSPKVESRRVRIEPKGKLLNYDQPLSLYARSGAVVEGGAKKELDDKSLDLRLLKIEEILHVQEGKGIDGFVKAKLESDGANILETLTNELLLGVAAEDGELLEQMIEIM